MGIFFWTIFGASVVWLFSLIVRNYAGHASRSEGQDIDFSLRPSQFITKGDLKNHFFTKADIFGRIERKEFFIL